MICIVFREVFHPGTTFVIFMSSQAAAKAFRMKDTMWIGAFVVIVNLEFYGMYKDMPVLTIKDPFIPVCYPKIDQLCLEPYHEYMVDSVSVILVKLLITYFYHYFYPNDICSNFLRQNHTILTKEYIQI
jgi:hypothetical protein